MVLKYIVVLLVDLGPNFVSIPLLFVELEILVISWAFFDVHVHLIFAHT
jgi:hypothetical protein